MDAMMPWLTLAVALYAIFATGAYIGAVRRYDALETAHKTLHQSCEDLLATGRGMLQSHANACMRAHQLQVAMLDTLKLLGRRQKDGVAGLDEPINKLLAPLELSVEDWRHSLNTKAGLH